MSIERKPNPIMKNILIQPIKWFLNKRSSIHVERNDTIGLKPPYLVVSNHVNNWDPLILNSYVKEPMCFIAGEPLFRNPLLRRILDYTGAIRKTKFYNDTKTIRSVIKAKQHGRVICIFPEGNRNWDGQTEPLTYSTSKLIKKLQIPVVTATIKGGHLSHPRWAEHHRKGQIDIEYKQLWDADDIRKNSVESIHKGISKALNHDEAKWQASKQYSYKGNNLAEYLERLLFMCPSCHSIGHLTSDRHQFICEQCRYTEKYTEYGTFSPATHFRTPAEWNAWQQSHVYNAMIEEKRQKVINDLSDHVDLYVSHKRDPFQHIHRGSLHYHEGNLVFTYQNNKLKFPIDKVEGLNVHFHHKLDFLMDDTFYRFQFFNPRTSAFKWLTVLNALQQTNDLPNILTEVESK
ncbi:1-acyl-sn-glycerol-3-phosphate acyltransferase [Alkalibacillus flavidus]|uniref:1-acyl-sn-glycerol-3-phosphate acyltransferase n=1 Tax=Alkalibacillus flavidus TaxID=546021 RepID=A0ABV2KYY3_9BACI